jgi:hypothetical protein
VYAGAGHPKTARYAPVFVTGEIGSRSVWRQVCGTRTGHAIAASG